MLNTNAIIVDGATISLFLLTYFRQCGIKVGDVKPFFGGCYIVLPETKMLIRIIGNIVSIDTETVNVEAFKPLFSLNAYDQSTIGYVMAAIKSQNKTLC